MNLTCKWFNNLSKYYVLVHVTACIPIVKKSRINDTKYTALADPQVIISRKAI